MIFFGRKKHEYYKGILMMVDLGMHEHIFEEVSARLKPGARILDLGCGEGALSQRLVDAGFKITSVDKNPDYFKCKGSQYVRVDFDDQAQLDKFIGAHNAYFDAVIGIEVIEHVENQWEYIRGLHRMCRSGGWVFVSTPNITSWLSRCQFFLTGKFHQFNNEDLSYGHISPLSQWEFNNLLTSVGFSDLQYRGIGTLPIFYITSLKTALASLLAFPFRLFQSGYLNGWCILAIGRKKDEVSG